MIKAYILPMLWLLCGLLPPAAAWGQPKNGKCEFKYEYQRESYSGSFEYLLLVVTEDGLIKDETKKNKANLDFTSSPGDFKVRINAKDIKWGSSAHDSKNKILVKPENITISGGNGLLKPTDYTEAKKGNSGNFSYAFEVAPNAKEEEGEIKIKFVIEVDGNEQSSPFTTLKINYKLKPYKGSPPEPKEDPILKEDQEAWAECLPQYHQAIEGGVLEEAEKAMNAYLTKFPEGYKVSDAKQNLAKVYHKMLEAAGDDTNKLKAFIQYCQGKDSAREAVNSAQEILDGKQTAAAAEKDKKWQSIQNSKCAEDLKSFLEDEKYKEEAKTKISTIKKNEREALNNLTARLNDSDQPPNDEQKLNAYNAYLNARICPNTSTYKKYRNERDKLAEKLGTLSLSLLEDKGKGVYSVKVISGKAGGESDIQLIVTPKGHKRVSESEIEKVFTGKEGQNSYLFDIEELEAGEYEIYAQVKGEKTETAVFDMPERDPELWLERSSDQWIMRIRGGEPPFVLFYKTPEQTNYPPEQHIELRSQRLFKEDAALRDQLAQLLKGIKEVDVSVRMSDGRGNIGEVLKISLESANKWDALRKGITYLGILSIFVIIFAVYGKKIKARLSHYGWARTWLRLSPPPDKIKKQHMSEQEAVDALVAETPENSLIKIKTQADKYRENQQAGIKISNKENATLPVPMNQKEVSPPERGQSLGEAILKDTGYFSFDLNEVWQNSIVRSILIEFSCAAAIEQAVREEYNRLDIKGETHPELGGFLLGRFNQQQDGTFYVAIEQYISAETTRIGEYEVELDPLSLDTPLSNYPDLAVVGWFHTHPGHSLFLSKSDLKVHQFFQKPYQFAMEMEPQTEDIEIAFFTRRTNGELNYREEDKKMDAVQIDRRAKWHSWDKVNKWRRTIKRSIS